MPNNETFLSMVAAVFEENFLHQVTKVKEMQTSMMLSIDYCLEKLFGDKKSS